MFAALLCLAGALPQDPPEPATALARLVDLPTAAARRAEADALAARSIPLDQWVAACRAFGTFAAKEPGPSRQTVPLQVLGVAEPTELFLYVPKDAPRGPRPLLLWGHGAGGSGAREYLPWQDLADRLGMYVLAGTEFGKEPGYGFSPRERQAQLAALRWARRQVDVDENAVFVGGASRGGHLTWDLALRWPDQFAGALPCIGGPRMQLGVQNNLRFLENVVRLPIRDLQGAQDDPLLLVNLRLAFARLQKLGAKDAVLHEFADRGHAYDLAAIDWAAFFALRREPRPARVVRLAADLAEARAHWVVITAFDEKVALEFAPQVAPGAWDALDEAGRRALLLDRLVERTARLQVTDQGRGRFAAEGRGVKSFTLLLTAEMLGKEGAVEVRWQNKTVRKVAAPSAQVLLREFAERFDRTFLPVASVSVP